MKEKVIALILPHLVDPRLARVLAEDLLELFLFEDYPASDIPPENITE
jgi:hypothetical protein